MNWIYGSYFTVRYGRYGGFEARETGLSLISPLRNGATVDFVLKL